VCLPRAIADIDHIRPIVVAAAAAVVAVSASPVAVAVAVVAVAAFLAAAAFVVFDFRSLVGFSAAQLAVQLEFGSEDASFAPWQGTST
jgi:hypothetical protein